MKELAGKYAAEKMCVFFIGMHQLNHESASILFYKWQTIFGLTR